MVGTNERYSHFVTQQDKKKKQSVAVRNQNPQKFREPAWLNFSPCCGLSETAKNGCLALIMPPTDVLNH